jgi:hypothetical protein
MIGILIATVLVATSLVPPQVKDAQSLYEYERANFTYQNEVDGVDDWKTPERTASDKGGDCEDYAFFTEKVLKSLGYEAHAIAIYGKVEGKRVAHAICVVQLENKKWRYFSNGYYSYFEEFESIKEIVEDEMPNWKMYGSIYLNHEMKDKHFSVTSGL